MNLCFLHHLSKISNWKDDPENAVCAYWIKCEREFFMVCNVRFWANTRLARLSKKDGFMLLNLIFVSCSGYYSWRRDLFPIEAKRLNC